MSPGELDILEYHLLNKSQLSGQSPAYSDTDNFLLKSFIASPEGEEAASRAISESLKTDSGSNYADNARSGSTVGMNSTGTSLEAALAALGDSGRQQLLAILQLANGSNNNGISGGPAGSSQGKENMSTHSRHTSMGTAGSPGTLTDQTANAPAELGRHPQQALNVKTTSKHHSGSYSTQSSPKNSIGQPSPTYYANAFHQYASGENARQGGSTAASHGGNGNVNTATTSYPSRTASAVSSAHPSPASAPVAGPSTLGASTSSWYRQQSTSKGDIDMLNSFNANDFANASQYRSPALVPGTSSSAFYSENGAGDDNDLLFTPLLSPALTASTQPGPSVGPLPESFANMGGTASVRDMYSAQNKKPQTVQDAMGNSTYPHVNNSINNSSQTYLPYNVPEASSASAANPSDQGISPLYLFSPLTSPAIRPQPEHAASAQQAQALSTNASQSPRSNAAQSQRNSAGISSRSSNASPKSNGSIKGASRNHPKTRPSPIIRPEASSTSHSRSSSITYPTNGHQTQSSSKRSISSSQSQQAQPSQRQTSSNSQRHSRAGSLNSTPASPATAFAPSSLNSSFIPPQRQTQQGFAIPQSRTFGMSNPTASNAAGPANMFDGTNMTPALAAAFLSGSLQYPPLHQQQDFALQQQQLQYLQQQQQINAFAHSLASSAGSMSAPPSSALEASGAHSVPSPLDLNSIFGLLGATGPSSASSPAYSAGQNLPMHQDGQPTSQFPSPAANTGSSGSGSHEDMLLDDMGKQPDASLPSDMFKDDASGLPLALTQFFRQQSSDQSAFSAANGGMDSQSNNNAAPLTPASFMNLPSNQYDLLAGLIADQSKLIPVLDANGGQLQHMDDNITRSTPYPHQQQQQQVPTDLSQAAALSLPEAPQATSAALATKADEINRTSPAFKAVQERAAAALAEKEAKASAKNRGKKRTAADATSANSAPTQTSAAARKNGKRAAGADMDVETVTGLGDHSGNVSLETSPNLLPADSRKSSHKVAEQRRRDSLKLCFEELRFILPPLTIEECDDDFVNGLGKRPGENNVGGQRGKASAVDPKHPNKGVSKVALLRKSNEYVTKLHERIDKRDAAIQTLREELRACRLALGQGVETDEAGLDALSAVDFEDLEEDCDNPAPTYKVHGIDIPGGPLSYFYKPSQPSIAEDAKEDESDHENQDNEDDKEEEYKQRRTKRSAAAGSNVSTRGSHKREKVER